MNNIIRFLYGLLVMSFVLTNVQAQGYPNQQVHLVVPYPAGGTADVLGRELAQQLAKIWDQVVIVENKAGAGGAIGVDSVVRSKPDGHQLVLGVTGALTIAPHMRKLPYDPLHDLAPISLVGISPSLLAVHPSVPANSVTELIALAQKQPGKLTFSSAGVGTSVHIAGELFKSMAEIDVMHVPYKGGAPSVLGLLGNEVSMTFENMSILLPHVRAGKLKGLAVTSSTRSSQADDIPPISDTLPGYQVTTWFGLFAPAGTPQEIINKINRDVIKVMELPSVRNKMMGQGIDIVASSPESLKKQLEEETARFAKVIKDAGISMD